MTRLVVTLNVKTESMAETCLYPDHVCLFDSDLLVCLLYCFFLFVFLLLFVLCFFVSSACLFGT